MEKPSSLNGVISRDIEEKQKKSRQILKITFKEYIELIRKDPLIGQISLSRIREMIKDKGTEEIPERERWIFGQDVNKRFKFFADELFGIDGAIAMVVNYIEGAANKGSTGKQILILVGPPASGKSTIVRKLMKGLENYRKRPVFMIQGCPKFEEPLHLLPRHLREDAAKTNEECNECRDLSEGERKHLHLGLKIDGDLCNVCRDLLMTQFKDSEKEIVRWWDVPVETFTFSIQGRRGLGSFEPTGEKASDVTALTGRENINITATKGYNHPKAFELTGEIPKGERGIVEGREILACEKDILSIFFSLGEERQIKVQGSNFPHISVDTLLVGHINLTLFKKFSTDRQFEGLHDRFWVAPVPYPIKISEEVAIYRKLIEQESDFVKLKKCHIAPGVFELVALFAVMTRLSPSQMGIDLLTKAKIFNGDMALTEIENKEKKPIDVRQLVEEGKSSPDIASREGMFGVSSRTTLAALNSAMVKQSDKNGCLTPLRAIRALSEVFDQRIGFSSQDVERFRNLLSAGESGESVMSEYRNFIVKTVTRAYLYGYRDLAKEIFDRYLEEIRLYCSQKLKYVRGQNYEIKRDEMTGKPKEPNMKFIKSVEVHLQWNEEQAEVARGELLIISGNDPGFGFDSYKPLREAAENKLISDSKGTLTLVLSTDKTQGEEEKKRRSDLFKALGEEGYCEVCAREAVEKARDFIGE